MISERIAELEKACLKRAQSGIVSHFAKDYHASALTMFADCPQWEKTARAMAYAIVNQDIYVEKYDRIGGRVYHVNEEKPECIAPDLDCDTEAATALEMNGPNE